MLKRISHEPWLIEEWIRKDGDGDHLYRLETAADYQSKIKAFQEKLLLIMHIVGGQLARASELLGMRYANTKQGRLRNILIDRGLMVFVTCYHKNYRSSGNIKIIHRYLPLINPTRIKNTRSSRITAPSILPINEFRTAS